MVLHLKGVIILNGKKSRSSERLFFWVCEGLHLTPSYQVQPIATQTVVEKVKLPKSVTEPWFNSKIESNDRTAGGALDLILQLRGELQKADSQLKYISKNY